MITAGANERQLRAINRTVAEGMAEAGFRPQRVEGGATSGWIVLDFGDVLVHIFSEDQRDFYRLEDLWAEAPTLLEPGRPAACRLPRLWPSESPDCGRPRGEVATFPSGGAYQEGGTPPDGTSSSAPVSSSAMRV